jgi:hypothetical protein
MGNPYRSAPMLRKIQIYLTRSELALIISESRLLPDLQGFDLDAIHFEVADGDHKHLSNTAIRNGGCLLVIMGEVGESIT